MSNEKQPTWKQASVTIALFLLFGVICALAGMALFIISPNANGIGNILLSAICAVPTAAYFMFFNPKFLERVKLHQRLILSAGIFPLFISLVIGWTLFEQRPVNIFKVFVSDPIPNGVSNIQARDISLGFDLEIVVAFDATPDAIEQIITINGLELDDDPYNFDRKDIPFEYFSNVNENQDWVFYSRYDRENINWWLLWVNADKTQAIYQFVDG